MTTEIKYRGKPYQFKYTLERYESTELGIFGEREIILEQDTLGGFLEMILKDTSYVYRIIYPCIPDHPNFDTYTGRWALQIGEFDCNRNENRKNADIVCAVQNIVEAFDEIKSSLK